MRILPVYNLPNNYLRFTFKSNDTSRDLVDKMREKRHDLDDSLTKNESSQDSVEDKISSVKSDIQTQTSWKLLSEYHRKLFPHNLYPYS